MSERRESDPRWVFVFAVLSVVVFAMLAAVVVVDWWTK